MNSFNIDNLVKAITAIILLSMSVGQFSKLREYALREGIKAVSVHGYKPSYFFSAPHPKNLKTYNK